MGEGPSDHPAFIPRNHGIAKRALRFLLLLPPVMLGAQFLPIVQYPPGIRWKSIATPHYEIVFPDVLENDALRAANALETLYDPLGRTCMADRRRFPVLLTNQGVEANGSVQLAPRKSEWFHWPGQGTLLGTGEWIDLLAAHEGRHMVKFEIGRAHV